MAMAKHNSSTVSWRNAAGRRPRSDRDCLRGVGEAGTALLGQRIVRLDFSEKGHWDAKGPTRSPRSIRHVAVGDLQLANRNRWPAEKMSVAFAIASAASRGLAPALAVAIAAASSAAHWRLC